MKEAIIHSFSGWEAAEKLNIDTALWGTSEGVSAWAKLAWDRDGLRVRLEAGEADIRAEERGPLGHPWEDSCLEFFLSPVEGDMRYINIELNPKACLCLGLGDGRERVRLLPERDWLEPKTFLTVEGWGVEYRVPFDLLRLLFPAFAPRAGVAMRGNLYKCGDKTVRPHFLAWNSINSPVPNFHRPQDFGRLVLGE